MYDQPILIETMFKLKRLKIMVVCVPHVENYMCRSTYQSYLMNIYINIHILVILYMLT